MSVNFANKDEAERVKDLVKNYLLQYLEEQGIRFKSDRRNFHCFNKNSHKNEDASASAGLSDDKRAFECHACGLKGDILTAVNIIEDREINGQGYFDTLGYLADMFGITYKTSIGSNKPKKEVTATYNFINENGEIQFKSVRREWTEQGRRKKEDIPYITDETGKLKSGFNGVSRIMYRLPELKKAIKNNEVIFFPEGMKCADIIAELGLNSTAIWGGSNAWTKPHTQNYIPELSGANIVILPDNDSTGKRFANDIAEDLKNITNSLKIINLNDDITLPEGGDIEEWLQLGGSKERLLELVDRAKEWKPEQHKDLDNDLPEWYEVNPKSKRVSVNTGLLARHLINNIPAIHSTGRFYLYKNGVYDICNNGEEKSVVMDHIKDKYRTMNLINDTASQWSIDKKVKVSPDILDKDPYILNFKNGLYNIKTRDLKEHSPEYLSTIQLNVSYDPDAKGEAFNKFIHEAVPDKENRLLVQEMMGYSLTSFNNAKKAFVFNGEGDTGKSTLLNIIEDMVTAKYISNIPIQGLGSRFNTAELFGKLVNIYADLPSTPIKDGSLLKVLTGGDKVQAERKGQDPFTFLNKAKFIFSCNGLPPNYGDRSEAFYNRLIIIPFNNSVPKEKQDPHLRKKLRKELDYIFQWALEGLERLIENNFTFTENEATKRAVEEYKLNSNSALMFVNECCELSKDSYISSTELYTEYKEFCNQNGFSPVSSINFSKELVSNSEGGIEKVRRMPGTNVRAFKGIKLISPVTTTKGNITTFPTAGGRI